MTESSVPEIRLSDAERDEVVSQLSLAMSEGRLDVAEFEQRSRTVYAARVQSDLDGVLEGLPVIEVRDLATSAVARPSTRSRRWFFSVLGDQRHQGNLDMGAKSTAIQVLGDVSFDLTQVTATEVDLQVFSLLGDVTIIVPPGAFVDVGVFSILGDRKDDLPVATTPSALRVRCRVYSLLGDVKVRTANN